MAPPPISRTQRSSENNNNNNNNNRGGTRMYIVFTMLVAVTAVSFLQMVNVMHVSGGWDTNNVGDNHQHQAVLQSLNAFSSQQSRNQQQQQQQTKKNKKKAANPDTSVDEDEDPIPNPPIQDGNTTFSACLLVMDDNHRLVECEY
eukprot:scaffold8973_cov78-Cylindrotheca_fusiformis.AAC.3